MKDTEEPIDAIMSGSVHNIQMMAANHIAGSINVRQKPIFEVLFTSVSKRVLVHNHSNGNE